MDGPRRKILPHVRRNQDQLVGELRNMRRDHCQNVSAERVLAVVTYNSFAFSSPKRDHQGKSRRECRRSTLPPLRMYQIVRASPQRSLNSEPGTTIVEWVPRA